MPPVVSSHASARSGRPDRRAPLPIHVNIHMTSGFCARLAVDPYATVGEFRGQVNARTGIWIGCGLFRKGLKLANDDDTLMMLGIRDGSTIHAFPACKPG